MTEFITKEQFEEDNKKWKDSEMGRLAHERLTGEGYTEKELIEIRLAVELRNAKEKLLTQDIERILLKELPHEDLQIICGNIINKL